MESIRRLIHEIHRRSLWQVLGIYLIAGWIALQVVQTLTESLGLPEWFPPLAVMLLIIGFPIVLATAFVQEGLGRPAPSSSASASEPAPSRSASAVVFTWRNALGGGVLAFALWGVVAAAWVFFGAGARGAPGGDAPGADARPVIAILPLENLAPDPEADQWFADGIHDELISEVAKISSLKVISRTSVLTYRGRDRPQIQEIGRQLGATAILEATVRRADDRVRVTAQLIDAVNEGHLWTGTYDRRSTDIFDLQAELARDIAGALRAELAPEEEAALGRRPTESLAAYDLYLRAKAAYAATSVPFFQATRQTLDLLDQALALDPGFAPAYALRAEAHLRLYIDTYDIAPTRLAAGRAALERALALNLDLVEARLHRAWLLTAVDGDDAAAVAELRAVLVRQPSSADAHARLAETLYGAHRFEEAATEWAAAVGLEPRSSVTLNLAAQRLGNAGDYEEAEPLLIRSLDVDPGQLRPRFLRARHLLATSGDIAAAGAQIQEAIRSGGAAATTIAGEGNYSSPLALVIPDRAAFLARVDTSAFLGDPLGIAWHFEGLAAHHILEGDTEEARRAAIGALVTADRALETLTVFVGVEVFRAVRARALAILGRRDEALTEVETLRRIRLERYPSAPHPAAYVEVEVRALLGDGAGAAAAVRRFGGDVDAPTPGMLSIFPFALLRDDTDFVAALNGT